MYLDFPFTSHYVQLGKNRIHYIDEGSGPVIVMVHGNPTWSYYYRNIITLLSKDHRVIAIDHMGCGLSDKPQDYEYTLKQHVENLERVLDSLHVLSFSLVVHDWGGAIGMGVATKYPERIEKIVILNTAAFRSSRIPFRIRICKFPLIGPFIVRAFNGFAWPATFMAVKKSMQKDVCSAYIAPYNSWNNRVAVSAFVKDIPLEESHVSYSTLEEIENGLSTIKDAGVPMMIIWGGKDFCFDNVFYEEWRQRFPEAECHMFPEGGHYILEDCRDEVAPLFSRFFETK